MSKILISNAIMNLRELPDRFEIRVDDIDIMRLCSEELEEKEKQISRFIEVAKKRYGYAVCKSRPLGMHHTLVFYFNKKG